MTYRSKTVTMRRRLLQRASSSPRLRLWVRRYPRLLTAGRSLTKQVDNRLVDGRRKNSPHEVVDFGYRLILGRAPDAAGQARFVRMLESGELSAQDVWATLANSPEFAARLHRLSQFKPTQRPTPGPDFVDVETLRASRSVEEHNALAENYFASVASHCDPLLAKPVSNIAESPELLAGFGQLLAGLRPLPGMVVLDFGAGSCWTSWFLTQLGCAVIATDVSTTALDIGRERFRRWPPVGDQPTPRFLPFDGRRFDLPDASVDRICCFDAYHHLANPAEVMAEFARVLKPGGLAGFGEPGAHHSTGAQSQFEMRRLGVIEGDVNLDEIAATARLAGLEAESFAVMTVLPHWVPLAEFADLVSSGIPGQGVINHLVQQVAAHQTFLLRKPGIEQRDSRDPSAIAGTVKLVSFNTTAAAGGILADVVVVATNTGAGLWLPSSVGRGAVALALRVTDPLPWEGFIDMGLDAPLPPGRSATVSGQILLPDFAAGQELSVGLVSHGVDWFETRGSQPLYVTVA